MINLPIHVLQVAEVSTWVSTEQNNHRLRLGWDKPQEKNISATTVIALENSFSKRAIFVQGHLFGISSHQMIDDVADNNQTSNTNQFICNIT